MGRPTRYGIIAAVVIIIVILIVMVAVPYFVNADSFRQRMETAMSEALGRKVTIGKLHVSIWSGSLVAENATVADDPRFSSQPFVQAKSVRIGVDLLPLVFDHELHVRGFLLQSPTVHLLRAPDGVWNYSSLGNSSSLGHPSGAGSTASPSSAQNAKPIKIPPNLTAGQVSMRDGRITIGNLPANGEASPPTYLYQKVEAQITRFTPTTVSPFHIGAELPGGGTLKVNGRVGPLNHGDTASTPIEAQVSVRNMLLGQTGVMPPDAGIRGSANLDGQLKSDGQTLTATGKGDVAKIQLAKDGQPSAKPLHIQFALSEDEPSRTGHVEQTTLTVGRATIQIGGTFQGGKVESGKPTTVLNLKIDGNTMPIDDLEAFLPSLGIHLPEGSRLQGGTLTTSLAVTGSTANPVIQGPVRVENTRLAGFDLGSKLQAMSQLTKGKIGNATGANTTIRSLSMNLTASRGAIRTDNIALDVPSIGTATGAGTVSQSGALTYDMLLKLSGLIGTPASDHGGATSVDARGLGGFTGGLAGLLPGGAGSSVAAEILKNGVPVDIRGTTSHPTFTVDTEHLASRAGKNAVQNLLNRNSRQRPGNANPEQPLKKALGRFLSGHQ